MILIAGIPDESPVELALDAAEEFGVGHYVFDQREHDTANLQFNFDQQAGWRGVLTLPDQEIDLSQLTGIYMRMMDERFLPDVVDEPHNSPKRAKAYRFHRMMHDWCNVAPLRVANRPRAMMSNMSKTFQAETIRNCGLGIPDTLVTNDPEQALTFVAQCESDGDEVIYKSVSGTRSIVQTFGERDKERLHRIRWCPVQFQRKVRGTDVRVHVIGNKTFAAQIESEATDYRYAHKQIGSDADVVHVDLDRDIVDACRRLSEALDLPFAGIDLRLTPDGGVICFEVNPSPAYSYYQSRTGAPIAEALVRWLSCDDTAQ